MPAPAEALRDLSAPLRRLGGEVASARLRPGVGRDEFVRLCRAYGGLARRASDVLGRPFPPRELRRDDLLLSGTGVRGAALDDLLGLVRDLESAVERGLASAARTAAAPAFRCLKAGGRPCRMQGEIDPRRFDVFFALPFRDPPTCKAACDAVIEWLETSRGIPPVRVFRADRWVTAGDFVCKICKAMQESALVVADITALNPNVYFELGLAAGMGKPVILLRDASAESRLPSDLLALEYVEYDGSAPRDEARLEHFGVVFDGVRRRG